MFNWGYLHIQEGWLEQHHYLPALWIIHWDGAGKNKPWLQNRDAGLGVNLFQASALANCSVTGDEPHGKPSLVTTKRAKNAWCGGGLLPPGHPACPQPSPYAWVTNMWTQPTHEVTEAAPYLLCLLDHLPHHLLQVGHVLLLARVREEGHPADAPVEGLVSPAQVQRRYLCVGELRPVGQRDGLAVRTPHHLAGLPEVIIGPPAAPQGLKLLAGEEVLETLLLQGLPVGGFTSGHQCLQGPTLLLAIVETGLGLCHLLVDVQLVQQEHLGVRHAAGTRSAGRLWKEGKAGPAPPHLACPSPPQQVEQPHRPVPAPHASLVHWGRGCPLHSGPLTGVPACSSDHWGMGTVVPQHGGPAVPDCCAWGEPASSCCCGLLENHRTA